MSENNKAEDKKCSFSPDQFKVKVKTTVEIENDVAAPIGSFPWAMIQAYLNKLVGRGSWPANVYLIPKYDDAGDIIYIQQSDTDGSISPWVPAPKDMVACDWELRCMLSFDLILGYSVFNRNYSQGWGYLADDEFSDINIRPFGALTKCQNQIDIENILYFYYFCWEEAQHCTLYLRVSANKDHYQNVINLLKKNLYVLVNGTIYSLGIAAVNDDGDNYKYTVSYNNDDAQKLGAIMKQTGEKKTFCFNWK
ncbi:Thoeris anti-defense Tad2 family protein [Xenorhabdus kozodoii]|uniref:Uncharacterized protein n=1 Tax=Xenorhabdus kozodoii TaxID=351676 RepID=A0A2D0LF15_9GAMM|nr:hypothetical protein [Xenorhabdus kozodoii]PHM74304.1 hypothetical protein Xkoz_00854 [Xenorhabdus kozodoii]